MYQMKATEIMQNASNLTDKMMWFLAMDTIAAS